MKRFQECNWIIKAWRYRYYIPVPFVWIYHMYIKDLIIQGQEFNEEVNTVVDVDPYKPKGKELYSILIGTANCDMNWTYTTEEVMQMLNERRDDRK